MASIRTGDYKDHADELARMAMRTFPEERGEEELSLISAWLRRQTGVHRRFFSLVLKDDAGVRVAGSKMNNMCKHIKLLTLSRGTLIFRQGDPGNSFYVIVDGQCEVLHRPIVARMDRPDTHEFGGIGGHIGNTETTYLGVNMGVIGDGDCFGELNLGFGAERSCSVVALGGGVDSKTSVLRIDREAFEQSIEPMFTNIEKSLARRVKQLKQLYALSDWPDAELGFLAYWMNDIMVPEGDYFWKHGGDTEMVYFLVEGTAVVHAKPWGSFKEAGTVSVESICAPEIIGDVAMVRRHKRHLSSVMAETNCAAMSISAALFRKMAFSDLPASVFKTATRMEDSVESREDWHNLRIEQAVEARDVKIELIKDIQYRFVACGRCGKKGHPPTRCRGSSRGGISSGASKDIGASTSGGGGGGAAPSRGRRSSLAGMGAFASSLKVDDLDVAESPEITPLGPRRMRTPRGVRRVPPPPPLRVRPQFSGEVDEDYVGSPKIVDPVKVKHDEAVKDIQSVHRAVNAFKRLVRPKTGASEPSSSPPKSPSKSALKSPKKKSTVLIDSPPIGSPDGEDMFFQPRTGSKRAGINAAARRAADMRQRLREEQARAAARDPRDVGKNAAAREARAVVAGSSSPPKAVTFDEKNGHVMGPGERGRTRTGSGGVGGVRRVGLESRAHRSSIYFRESEIAADPELYTDEDGARLKPSDAVERHALLPWQLDLPAGEAVEPYRVDSPSISPEPRRGSLLPHRRPSNMMDLPMRKISGGSDSEPGSPVKAAARRAVVRRSSIGSESGMAAAVAAAVAASGEVPGSPSRWNMDPSKRLEEHITSISRSGPGSSRMLSPSSYRTASSPDSTPVTRNRSSSTHDSDDDTRPRSRRTRGRAKSKLSRQVDVETT